MNDYIKDVVLWPPVLVIIIMNVVVVALFVNNWINPPPPGNFELILDSLSCDELKEWIKYKSSKLAEAKYVEGCL